MTKIVAQNTWLLYLILLSFPFGPAVANIVAGITIITLFRRLTTQRMPCPDWTLSLKLTFLGGLLYVLWMGFVSILNIGSISSTTSALLGYLPWAIFPCLVKWAYPKPSQIPWGRLYSWLIGLVVVWTIVIISQYIFEWRFFELSIIPNEPRPRGFYSHPLSLAYGLLLFWPLALLSLRQHPRRPELWLFAVSIAIGLVLTQSRTVQAFSALLLFFNVFQASSGRRRKALMGVLLLGATLVVSTPNLVRDRFMETFSAQGLDRHSSYADDRLAFWHVHFLLIQERPLIGHGWGMDDAYRTPYYERIGLPNFIKPYGAHNVFIQILAEGGIIGLAFFLLWLSSLIWFVCTGLDPFCRSLGLQSLIAFFLASLTQNTMQDFSVRVLLTWLCTALLLSANLNHTQEKETYRD